MRAAVIAEFLELQPFGSGLLVLGRRVVPIFALRAFKRDDVSHDVSIGRGQPLRP
jgi:hypothetical protein